MRAMPGMVSLPTQQVDLLNLADITSRTHTWWSLHLLPHEDGELDPGGYVSGELEVVAHPFSAVLCSLSRLVPFLLTPIWNYYVL